jgi:prephenate dehydratase
MTPPASPRSVPAGAGVAFLGPPGTFGEEALLTQPDLAEADLVPLRSMPDVLAAVAGGEVDFGFVAIENSIEGTVNQVIDGLVFDRDLYIQREVVLEVSQCLIGPPALRLADIRRVVSIPHAIGQCRGFFAANLTDIEEVAANSTAEAVRLVGEERPAGTAALGPALAAKLYGLEVLAADIEDHDDNRTRFVLVGRPGADSVPAPTGHDKTSIVCFQNVDAPGSLHAILGQFSARNLNLTKLESRPTKRGLGDYCFIIDLEGHVDDEVVADCLRDLHASLATVKFLGSYPAAGEHGPAIRRDAEASWRAADEWVSALRGMVTKS